MWLSQDYKGPTELVIFNTAPLPLKLGNALAEMPSVISVHAPTNSTGGSWSSLGEVRNAPLSTQPGTFTAVGTTTTSFCLFICRKGLPIF